MRTGSEGLLAVGFTLASVGCAETSLGGQERAMKALSLHRDWL